MKRLIFALAVSLWLLGCSDSSSTGQEQTSAKKETVVAMLPLTGDLAFLGEPGQRAIKLALEDLSSQGSAPPGINVIFVDTEADPKKAVTKYQEARAKYDAKYFITTLTGVSEAVKPLVKEDDALQMIVAIHPNIMAGATNAIRFCFSAAQEVDEMTNFLLTEYEGKKIGLLVSKDPTSHAEATDYLEPTFKKRNIAYSRQDFNVGQKDFRTVLQTFVRDKVDILVILGYGSDTPAVLRQLATIDPEGHIQVVGGIALVEFPEWATADYLNRVISFVGPSIAIDGLANDQKNSIARRYTERYGAKYMPYDAAFTYDAVVALTDVLGDHPASTWAARTALLHRGNDNGVAGKLDFKENGDVHTDMKWMTYRNGKLLPEINHAR